MAWGRKEEELPESLRGLTPEQVAAKLADAEALRAKNTELETKLTETNSRFETFTTDFNTKFDQLASRLPAPQQRQENNNGDNEPTSFLLDGDRAFNERAAPLYGAILSVAEANAKADALRSAQLRQRTIKNNIDGTLFERFESEIAELAKTCTPQQRANSATWEHLFFNVKGRHSDTIAEHNREHKGDFFVETATRAAAQDEAQKDQLTDQEKRLAKKMGVSEEAYLTQKKGMSTTGIPEELVNS